MPTALADVPSTLERVIRRDRVIMASGLALVTLLAWIYLLKIGASMKMMTMDGDNYDDDDEDI